MSGTASMVFYGLSFIYFLQRRRAVYLFLVPWLHVTPLSARGTYKQKTRKTLGFEHCIFSNFQDLPFPLEVILFHSDGGLGRVGYLPIVWSVRIRGCGMDYCGVAIAPRQYQPMISMAPML
jgi:hypothetical protein